MTIDASKFLEAFEELKTYQELLMLTLAEAMADKRFDEADLEEFQKQVTIVTNIVAKLEKCFDKSIYYNSNNSNLH
jgi:hypothetical protein